MTLEVRSYCALFIDGKAEAQRGRVPEIKSHTFPGLKLLTAWGSGHRHSVGRGVIMEEAVDTVLRVPRWVTLVWPAASPSLGMTVEAGSLLLLSKENLHHKVFLQ